MIGSDAKWFDYNRPSRFLYTVGGVTYDSNDGSCEAFDIIRNGMDWTVIFKQSGTFQSKMFALIDVCCVGGGGGGAYYQKVIEHGDDQTVDARGGGGGGYVSCSFSSILSDGQTESIIVGAGGEAYRIGSQSTGGTSSAFGVRANGGSYLMIRYDEHEDAYLYGAKGGSGGASSAGSSQRVTGGRDGTDGEVYSASSRMIIPGAGSHSTTRAFFDQNEILLSNGGSVNGEGHELSIGEGGSVATNLANPGERGAVLIRRHKS